jgi:hypothetical protein
MNRKSSTVLFGSIVIGIVVMLAIYMGLIVTGVIDTRPSALVVAAGSAQREFDGTPLTCEEYTIKKGVLKKGHKLEVTYGASQTEVGWIENVASVKVKDALGVDVTNHYKIETLPGKLTVTPCRLIVASGDTQKAYDGIPLTYEMWDIILGKLPEGYSATARFTGAQLQPGQSENSFVLTIRDIQGNPVPQSFEIIYRFGDLTVTRRPISVTSYGATKTYDGKALRYENYTVDGEVLPAIEIIPKEGFYDYANKYQGGKTLEICPAPIDDATRDTAAMLTRRAFDALRLGGYARFDWMLDEAGGLWCLEANTLPGMTPTSLLPQMAAAVGMDYDTLCEKLTLLALK